MAKKLIKSVNAIVLENKKTPIYSDFINRIKDGNLTKDENPYSHFCIYFAGYDPEAKKVFIGHHKKSGLWLFNGGHIDKGETPEEALEREIKEEWGTKINIKNIGKPKMLTITPINNPTKQKCTKHYDIWFFVPLSKKKFTPDQTLLETEFYTTAWKSINEAKNLIIEKNTLKAISKFEEIFNKKLANQN
jgi:8-oxo-dGTP pyrophosphatase MutT (NUDIX family)